MSIQTAKQLATQWKLPRLPTIPLDPHPSWNIWDRRNPFSLHNFVVAQYPTFQVYFRPLPPLKAPAPPYYEGSIMLRSYLYAREMWPEKAYWDVGVEARSAIHDSFRIDGLPRVTFALRGKKELEGRLKAFWRIWFLRRGKVAFRKAIEEIRAQNPDHRCDLNLFFLLRIETKRSPFEHVYRDMYKFLTTIRQDFRIRGEKNALQSKPFLADRSNPIHILHAIEKKMNVSTDPQEIVKARKEFKALMRRKPTNFFDVVEDTTKGRVQEMQILDDGSLVPVDKAAEDKALMDTASVDNIPVTKLSAAKLPKPEYKSAVREPVATSQPTPASAKTRPRPVKERTDTSRASGPVFFEPAAESTEMDSVQRREEDDHIDAMLDTLLGLDEEQLSDENGNEYEFREQDEESGGLQSQEYLSHDDGRDDLLQSITERSEIREDSPKQSNEEEGFDWLFGEKEGKDFPTSISERKPVTGQDETGEYLPKKTNEEEGLELLFGEEQDKGLRTAEQETSIGRPKQKPKPTLDWPERKDDH